MGNVAAVERLAEGIRDLNRSNPPALEEAIEVYLERELGTKAPAERLLLLEGLIGEFPGNASEPRGLNLDQGETARILSLLSGTEIDLSGQTPGEITEKFAASLNTLFDTLNRIIAVIHGNLLGEKPELETIRHVIGSQIEGGNGETSLKEHLEQIQKAFLISHRAFQEAAGKVVGEMLAELDPETLAGSSRSILSFGPMRKAEIFDSYREKYRECRKWFDTGRFSEKLLREFEKICQKGYRGK
jgi:hypothetical protein